MYFAFLSLFMSMKCEDELVPQGTQVNVHGRIYDEENQLPVVNHKLTVSEFNERPIASPPGSREDYIGDLGIVYTDENGYYDLTFTTSGRGDTYYIRYERNDYLWTYWQDQVELDVTISNEVNFDFRHLYSATLKIIVADDLEYLPVVIIHSTTYSLSSLTESGENTRPILIDKNAPVKIEFRRRMPDDSLQKAFFEFPPTNTTEPTEFEIHLTNDDFQ